MCVLGLSISPLFADWNLNLELFSQFGIYLLFILLLWNIIQLKTGCEGSSKFIVPRNTNYFPK